MSLLIPLPGPTYSLGVNTAKEEWASQLGEPKRADFFTNKD
jgi:hypothetical protein